MQRVREIDPALTTAALLLSVALGVCACSGTPNTPSGPAALTGVATTSLAWSTSSQPVTLNGQNLHPLTGGTMTGPIGQPSSSTATLAPSQIQNLSSTSVRINVLLPIDGTYTFQGSDASGATLQASIVVADRPAACAAPARISTPFSGIRTAIVRLNIPRGDSTNINAAVTRLSSQFGFQPTSIYVSVLSGFAASLPDLTIDGLRCDSAVQDIGYSGLVSIATAGLVR